MNVATLYGLEHEGDRQFLVMELVEGETLAERIARGPIPWEEARSLFIQIAEGLEAAHEKGIIHRDLKPANIKITPEGKLKILDFGLAKAFATEGGVSAETSQSPTLTKDTALGAIMGTAGYMSPEQARGKLVDRRTDVWAFGCCLFEALTARAAFEGETVPDILSEVLGKDPDWTRLPESTPQRARELLSRALRKDVSRRLQHVGDARIELLEEDEPGRDASRGLPKWIWAAAVALVVLGFLTRMLLESSPIPASADAPFRARIPLPDGAELVVIKEVTQTARVGRHPSVAISRDGRHLAIVAEGAGGTRRVYTRSLDALEFQVLDGTEDAVFAFFSPDGEWVGVLTENGHVSRVPVEGGVRATIGDAPFAAARGAAWVSDDVIVLGGNNSALTKMDAVTGEVEPLTEINDANRENYHAWPHALPDEEHVLFTNWGFNGAEIWVVSLDTKQSRRVEGTQRATQAHYIDSGHLVFFREGGLFAAPFSLATLTIEGPVVNVPQSDLVLGWDGGVVQGYFAVSRSGDLVAVPGEVDLLSRELVRVDLDGRVHAVAERAQFGAPAMLSHHGERVPVYEDVSETASGLALLDLARGSRTLLPVGLRPVWSADDRAVFYSWWDRSGDMDLFTSPVDGSADPEPLVERPYDQFAFDASSDGKLLLFGERHPDNGVDLHLLTLDTGEAAPFIATPANEGFGAFSPDSRWVAFSSDESGRPEIYVRSVNGARGKLLVSNDGGTSPRWSSTGDAIFFRRGSAMMSVDVELEPEFRASTPELLFEGEYSEDFDVFPDGKSFLMLTLAKADLREIEVVTHWSTKLAELAPVDSSIASERSR